MQGLEDISLLDLEMYANGCYTDATDLLLLPEDPSDSLVLTGAAASTRTGSVHPNTEALPEQVFNNVPSVNGPLNHGILPPLPNIGPSQEQPVTAHLVPPESMHVGGSYGAFDALPVDAMGSGLHYQDVAMMTGRSPFVLPTMSMPAGSAYGGHLSTMQHAASMVSYASAPVVDYCSDERLTRMSLKVFNATPDQLMPNVRQEIENLLRVSATVLEGYIRPGCVHVTIDARVSAGAPGVAAGGELLQAMQNILDRDALGPEASDDMLVQTGGELIVVKKRRVVAVINTVQSASVMPNITSVRPLAVAATSGRRTPALLVGERIAADGAVVMCRQGGRNITVEMKDTPVRHGERDVVQVALLGLRPGCAEVEVQTGAFLGNARPLLVLPDEAAVKEIRQLETAGRKGIAVADTDSFLRDMGFVVQYICRDAAKTQGFPLPTYTPQLVDTIQRVACRLVAAAAARSWTAVVRMLLPAVTAGQSHAAAAAAMNACCPSGFSLLHVAVGTGNAVVVKELIGWAAAAGPDAGIPWAVDARGPAGVTPLHVAALLPEAVRAAMRAELTALSSAVDKMWSLTLCDEGSSPEMMAEQFSAGMPSSTSNSDATAFVARESEAKKELAAESISAAGGPVMKPLMDKGENGEWVPSEQDLPPDRQMHRRKARGIIKRQLDDLHIGVLMSEVGSLPQADVVAVPGGLWASTMGTAVAMGMGFAAVLLHALA